MSKAEEQLYFDIHEIAVSLKVISDYLLQEIKIGIKEQEKPIKEQAFDSIKKHIKVDLRSETEQSILTIGNKSVTIDYDKAKILKEAKSGKN